MHWFPTQIKNLFLWKNFCKKKFRFMVILGIEISIFFDPHLIFRQKFYWKSILYDGIRSLISLWQLHKYCTKHTYTTYTYANVVCSPPPPPQRSTDFNFVKLNSIFNWMLKNVHRNKPHPSITLIIHYIHDIMHSVVAKLAKSCRK